LDSNTIRKFALIYNACVNQICREEIYFLKEKLKESNEKIEKIKANSPLQDQSKEKQE